MPKKSWVTWKNDFPSTWARETRRMLPFRLNLMSWNFPLSRGAHFSLWRRKPSWRIFNVLEKTWVWESAFSREWCCHFPVPFPTLIHQFPTHWELAHPWGDAPPLSLLDFYLSRQPLFVLNGWFGHWTSAPVLCILLSLWNKGEGFGCILVLGISVVISCVIWGITVLVSCFILSCSTRFSEG